MFKTIKGKIIVILTIIFLVSTIYYRFTLPPAPNLAPEIVKSEIRKNASNISNPYAMISTIYGNIGIELYPEVAPQTVKKFTELIANNFYNNKKFFNVVKDNYIMAGEQPGLETTNISLPLETSPFYTHRNKGTVGMYHPTNKPDSANNQFYITLSPQPARDGAYTIFAQVRSGVEILDLIKEGDKIIDIKILQK